MKKHLIKAVSVLLTLILFIGSVGMNLSAASSSQLQSEINKLKQENQEIQSKINSLKNNIAKQEELKAAIEQKIANVHKQINLCNQEISQINSKIAANEKEIKEKNAEIEADELAFKKRIRAIYMSNTSSSVQVLLGADNFSQFLELSQLTASVSARDKLMIEKITAALKVLEEKQQENDKLLKEQLAVKETVTQKQKELEAESKEIQSVIININSNKKDLESEQSKNASAIKDMESELSKILNSSNSDTKVVYDGGPFLWPTPGITKITSGYGSRWGSFHKGIDISNGQWGGRIVAIADGEVTLVKSGCTHDYRKNPLSTSCSCGGGYGNYIVIDHGKDSKGNRYEAYYAHMQSVAVSLGQTVKKGQVVGYVGCTGRSTGPHLHFGLMVNNKFDDPMHYYSKVK